MTKIIETYEAPVANLSEMAVDEKHMRNSNVLRPFGEACRRDMDLLARLPQGLYAGASGDELVNE